ncbi:helix-turn-helix domain-containing protein [Lactococcus garvieae]|uniref:helix-turn-helix domain-containing protein n=1 Tax=Lactococcus garvieae TaxID=1363 RepID=UPI002550A283|nr:helix-turn-helix transcriptional regulator [Lactococcus garvieae]
MYLTSEIKTALRKKRGALNLTKGQVAEALGISRLTYGRLESPTRNEKVRQGTYESITQWLAKDLDDQLAEMNK